VREPSDLGYVDRMKPNQMIGLVLILAAVVCFWVDTIDKAHSDWKLEHVPVIFTRIPHAENN
jgi:hypothetical protein